MLPAALFRDAVWGPALYATALPDSPGLVFVGGRVEGWGGECRSSGHVWLYVAVAVWLAVADRMAACLICGFLNGLVLCMFICVMSTHSSHSSCTILSTRINNWSRAQRSKLAL